MIRPVLLVLAAMLLPLRSISQQLLSGGSPPNTLCTGATVVPVTVGTPIQVHGNNENSLTDPVLLSNVVWEGFTTMECTDLTVSYCGTDPAFLGGLAYLAVGCPLTNLVFNSNDNVIANVCGDWNFAIFFPELPAGTYYYPVFEAPGSSGDYTLTFSAAACSATPPANAYCDGAIELATSDACAPVTGTVEHAAAAGNPGSSCAGGDASDGVWYSFVATSSANDITVAPSDQLVAVIELFAGACPDPAPLMCTYGNDFGLSVTLSATGLMVGETYLIRISDWYAGTPRSSTFEICVVEVPAAGCDADAGTLGTEEPSLCWADPLSITASAMGDAVVPDGFEVLYLLTSGQQQVIADTAEVPSFQVAELGSYTVHTLVYDPATLELSGIVLGETPLVGIEATLVQGGGSICGSLDMAGVSVIVRVCCEAEAGTLVADSATVCLDGTATVIAIVAEPATVPEGFLLEYVLVSGADSTVQARSAEPQFEVNTVGDHTIHALVYDPLTFDADQGVVVGETTVAALQAVFDGICGSIDRVGASIRTEQCCDADAGTVVADDDELCYPNTPVSIGVAPAGNAVIPPGFDPVYVLVRGQAAIVQAVSSSPVFEVAAPGAYAIHMLVHDPTTLALEAIVPGETTVPTIEGLLVQGGGAVCASLSVGAYIEVLDCRPVNDDCSAAQELPVSLLSQCAQNTVSGDNTYATQGPGDVIGCDAAETTLADVWYRFNSGDNSEVSIVLDPGTMTHWGVAVSDACSGGELICETLPAVPIDLETVPQTDYWVRIYSDKESGSPGIFGLCIIGVAPTIVCDGGTVRLGDGTSMVTICQDGDPDVIDVVNTSSSTEQYSYVVTDADDEVVTLMAMGSLDFNALPMGSYRVRGISHNGSLQGVAPGSPVSGITSAGACFEWSDDHAFVDVEICNSVVGIESGTWSVFPNPADGLVNIRYTGGGAFVAVDVIDMGGRLVWSEGPRIRIGEEDTFLMGTTLSPGMYMIRLSAGGTRTTHRLTVH